MWNRILILLKICSIIQWSHTPKQKCTVQFVSLWPLSLFGGMASALVMLMVGGDGVKIAEDTKPQ